jgi:hypothetical protein
MFLFRNRIATIVVGLVMMASGSWGQSPPLSITIDGTGTGKIFQGLGG